MEVKPNYTSLDGVFSENTLYSVPKYQRAYSWEKENIQQFCSDIKELYDSKVEKGIVNQHFLGGIVCVKMSNDDELDDKSCYQLVDGQQRLSTTVIFISRIIFFINELKLNEELSYLRERRVNKYKNKYIRLLFEENSKEVYFPRLRLSERDKEYFNESIGFEGSSTTASSENKTEFKSHQLIDNSIFIIDKFIKDFNSESPKETLSKIDLLYKIISKSFKILVLKMVDVNDAYRLFQVINDRGRSLTSGDLLRASSLGMADQNGISTESLKKLELYWDEITNSGAKLTDSRLIAYYVSKKGKNCPKTSLFENFNSVFFNDADKIEEELRKLKKGVELYTSLKNGVWPYKKSSLTEYQKKKLNNLVVTFQHTQCLSLLIAGTSLKEKKFYQLIFFLEKFFFMFKTALQKRMTPVTKMYLSNINKINDNPDAYQIKFFLDDVKKIIEEKVQKEEFISYVDKLQYQEGGDNRNIKFILTSLEESWKWIENKKTKGALGMYKDHLNSLAPDSYIYTIEHIYSRNNKKTSELEEYKNNIPNLTLLVDKDNRECGNKSFSNKLGFYKKSGLNITINIGSKYSKWNKKQYEENKEDMFGKLESIFFLDM